MGQKGCLGNSACAERVYRKQGLPKPAPQTFDGAGSASSWKSCPEVRPPSTSSQGLQGLASDFQGRVLCPFHTPIIQHAQSLTSQRGSRLLQEKRGLEGKKFRGHITKLDVSKICVKPLLCCLLAVQPQISHQTSCSLSFCICTMGLTAFVSPASQDVWVSGETTPAKTCCAA